MASRPLRVDDFDVDQAAPSGRLQNPINMDLLVSHPPGCYSRAKHEVARILGRLGDPEPRVEKSGVPGISIVHTALDSRHVVARCIELYRAEPGSFRFAIKWMPVDGWCEKNLDAMRHLIETQMAPRIGAQETWAMRVEKRGWNQYHTAEIVRPLAEAIDRKVKLKMPDKVVWVDVLRDAVAMSVLRPDEIFSIYTTPQ